MCWPHGCAGGRGAVKGHAARDIARRRQARALDRATPALGDGHTHEEHATRGASVTKGWTRSEPVRILFSWSRMRRKAIGGCGWGTWRRMRCSWCAAHAGAAWNIFRASCNGGVDYRRIPWSSICSSGCGVRDVMAGEVSAPRYSTTGRAAIARSRGWSGSWWRGSEMLLSLSAFALAGQGYL